MASSSETALRAALVKMVRSSGKHQAAARDESIARAGINISAEYTIIGNGIIQPNRRARDGFQKILCVDYRNRFEELRRVAPS